jgi:DNA repair photolyase
VILSAGENQMNKLKEGSQMYQFITHTLNIIKGKCSFSCDYCYNRKWDWSKKPLRLDEKALNENLGKGNYIFIGSSTDMFANDVPDEWIVEVLKKCWEYPDNTYLFQSKNPSRFLTYLSRFPKDVILGTTIETDIEDHILKYTKAPGLYDRVETMKSLAQKTMLTLEPLMRFTLLGLLQIIETIKPDFLNIGADSGGNGLPEPTSEELKELISGIEKLGIKVNSKHNLSRLLNG